MTDIVERLENWKDSWGCGTIPLAKAAADEITRLRNDLRVATETLDRLKKIHDTTVACWNTDLATSQAREAQLREAIAQHKKCCESGDGWTMYYDSPLHATLTLPTDDTALRERLKAERERCAKAFSQWDRDGRWAASVIRNLGDE